MKRTKEAFHWAHPQFQERKDLSGCTYFEGEDLTYEDRQRFQAKGQKQWIQEQIREKELIKQKAAEEKANYAKQSCTINRMRGRLQEEQTRRQRLMAESMKEHNLTLVRFSPTE